MRSKGEAAKAGHNQRRHNIIITFFQGQRAQLSKKTGLKAGQDTWPSSSIPR